MANQKYPEPQTIEEYRWAILKLALWSTEKIYKLAKEMEKLERAASSAERIESAKAAK